MDEIVNTKQQQMSQLANATFINLWSRAKNNKVIQLVGFDKTKKSHLFVLQIAKVVQSTFGFNIWIDVSKFSAFRLSKKIDAKIIGKKSSQGEFWDIETLIKFMEDSLEFEQGCEQAYDEYYRKENK